MGWNTSALFIKNRTADEALSFLPDVFAYEPAGLRVSAEEAMSGSPRGRIYLRTSGGWCELWDPDQRFAPRVEDIIEIDGSGILAGTTALAVLFSSVLSTYGFWLFEDGKLVRHAVFDSGKPVAAYGTPLPVESELEIPSWGHDEEFVWAVISAVTGSSGELDAVFDVYGVE
jgi:hypothetical protein